MTNDILLNKLAHELLEKTRVCRKRIIIGITGGPAAGKSTLSKDLEKCINQMYDSEFHGQKIAVSVPMDGFHYSNKILNEKGLYPVKGCPETFDADKFVKLIRRLNDSKSQSADSGDKANNVVRCPAYDRSIHEPVDDAIIIEPDHKIIIVEGNYLLLQREPYNLLKGLFDEVWYIECSEETAIERLIERHMAGGRTREEAILKIKSTDMPNIKLVEETKELADKILYV